jgi:hypothetical protein
MAKGYPVGKPVPMHKSIATGEKLGEAQSETKVGGSKKDKSRGTNR